jgi:hypothetical protein
VTLLVVEKRIKNKGVRINNKIASIKDLLFDTFKNGKSNNLIQIKKARLLLKGKSKISLKPDKSGLLLEGIRGQATF